MGILYITEYAGVAQAQIGGNYAMVPVEPPLAEQAITYGATTPSAAFNPSTTLVRLHTDSICSVLFGTTPIATAASARMGVGQTEYHGVRAGLSMKVAAITNT